MSGTANRLPTILTVTLAIAATCSAALAAGRTGTTTERTWRSSTGKYEVAATFLDYRQEKVQLRKADGKEIWV